MKNIINIRNIVVAIITIIILIWAFFNNEPFIRIAIIPFLVCASASLGRNICLMLNKQKIADIFSIIYRISFFAFFFGFLAYMTYYSIITKNYSFIPFILIFVLFGLQFFKGAFFNKE